MSQDNGITESPTLPTPTENTDIDEILVNLWQGDNFYSKWPESGKKAATDKSVQEAKAAIEQKLTDARIDELKELQMAPDVSDDSKDDNYLHYIRDRLKALQASKEGK